MNSYEIKALVQDKYICIEMIARSAKGALRMFKQANPEVEDITIGLK